MTTFWSKPCAYDDNHKRRFHRRARRLLKQLASHLNLPSGSYDIRSNPAGPAVSGEITLHADSLYVQASQSSMGPVLLYRTCGGRQDYVGGTNHFAPLALLNDLPALLTKIQPLLSREVAHV